MPSTMNLSFYDWNEIAAGLVYQKTIFSSFGLTNLSEALTKSAALLKRLIQVTALLFSV